MSNQKQDHPSVKVCIPGVSGVGKSTLFEKLIRRERAKWIFLFDKKHGDFSRRFGAPPCFDTDEIIAAIQRGGYVIFDYRKLFPGKAEKGFEFFTELIWPICQELKGRKIFGSDEIDDLTDTRSEPDALVRMLDEGRTFQVDCFFISQAMNTIHNLVRKQMTEIFAFRQGDPNGVQWLVDKGYDREQLTNLRNGEWIYKNTVTGNFERGGTAFEPKNSGRNLTGL